MKEVMSLNNRTQVIVFEFFGLSDDKELAPFLFMFFLLVYIVTICGNAGMTALVYSSPSLHTPMYYLLSYLSMVDLFYTSVIAPKMLADLLSEQKLITFIGCALQFYFFCALACTEVFVLLIMAYDRYVAICRPLHYVLIMTEKCLGLVVLSFSVGFLQSVAQTSSLFSLDFCDSNLIDHFYCDIPPLVKLSCSDTHICTIVTLFFVCFCSLSSLVTIVVSYTLIISSILQINSSAGRRKAFSTCSSHLTCSTILYVTIYLTYLPPSRSSLKNQEKVASVFFTVVTPMLNPLIYSLRNQEVKRVILQKVQKRTIW